MTFRKDAQIDRSRGRRGGGGGPRGLAVGGGLGGLVLVGLFLLLGGDPGQIFGTDDGGGNSASNPQIESGEQAFDHCQTGEDANTYDDCRLLLTAQSVDDVWARELPAQAGINYTQPGLTIFNGQVATACGNATSASGPFYCPGDESTYFDTSFFEQMRQFGGENAPLSQMYILAHEIGHHIQNLEGTLSLSDYNNPGEDSNAVRIELQADCYAGIWAHYADSDPNSPLEPISDEQLRDALTTAAAVGDDNIQQRSGREVNPESWTHGSSEQRQQAFLDGYRSGQMRSCDYLQRGAYAAG